MFKEHNNLPKPEINSDKTDFVSKIKDNKKVKEVKKAASKVNNAVNMVNTGKQFLNQPLLPNEPSISKDKLWVKQPTSKIFNADSIPESAIVGINRVVKLDIHVEGKPIKYCKHCEYTEYPFLDGWHQIERNSYVQSFIDNNA